ncbi:N-acetylmuramoyl-L-alanine amidase [Bacillus swezeyi]|uniref:cell wall-binding repeat-containing protein n=1 Tax=Bacillus swezeyi TaxID=1925020 RepID=UPI002E235A4A|nr:N-acetylmuramoyl-L-alanine amidase [Bacillus swezeyi]
MRRIFKVLPICLLGLVLFIPSALADNTASRIAGKNRYDTAVQASKKGWSSASAAVVVGGGAYADAISAAPFAYQKNAPLLLTNSKNLSSETKSRLKELKTKTVYIIGGTPAVSNRVASQIKNLGITVKRIAGKNRYDTAAKVAKSMSSTSKAVIANGFLYADPIAVIPYAAKNGYPILFTNQKTLNSYTSEAMKSKGIKQTFVIGSTGSINSTLYRKLPSPTRISGKNRYDLSVNIAKKFSLSTSNTYVSNGFKYADSISGAALAAKQNKAIILTNGENLSKEPRTFIGDKSIKYFSIMGGTPSVASKVANQLKNPAVGKTIFIDPGHGDQDPGAIGNGLKEKDVNLDIAKRLNSKLYSAGALPVMSRSNDTFYSLEERVKRGANAKADLFISIHANSYTPSSNGTETYYDKNYQSANSKRLAEEIQPRVVSAFGTRNRGVKTAGFYVIKNSKMPSVLIETAFITNSSDASKLKSATLKDRAAKGINDAVSVYYR